MQDKILQASVRASELMLQFGLDDWKINARGARTYLAQTDHVRKTITVSKYFMVIADKDEFDGVVLHEIAHALVGPFKGHGDEFTAKCKEIGTPEKYSGHQASGLTQLYKMTCEGCGQTGGYNGRSQLVCGICAERGEIHIMKREKNVILVREWS